MTQAATDGTMAEVMDRLTEIFRTTFGDEAIALDPAMTADDIEAWDSVSHIMLIYAVEEEFGITFSTRDIEGFENVGSLRDAVVRRL
jgi:acyl carrier protein